MLVAANTQLHEPRRLELDQLGHAVEPAL